MMHDVVVLLFYIHSKQLWLCQGGQLALQRFIWRKLEYLLFIKYSLPLLSTPDKKG